ncbi:helix-turn-helix transcriptional regulator [Streptomyces tanashiensis]
MEAEFRAAERGPGRRYYRLTALGRERLTAESGAWLAFHRAVQTMLSPGGTTP